MTEKEKCKRGLLYNANYDEELIEERMRCKTLCSEYNALPNSDLTKRNALINQIIGVTKDDFLIEQPFWCDYGYNIEVGKNFYSNHNLIILDAARVTFGDHVFVAPNCGFYTSGHPIDVEQRNEGLEYAYPITVGNNVWIGANVTVLPGVSIGDNTVIGAGSVVNKSIPGNVVAVGNPCKVVKKISEKEKHSGG